MNGMERLTDAAARWSWELQASPRGYSRTVYWHRQTRESLQTIEVYRRVDGGVTYGSRTWGPKTTATAPKVTDQVLTWMQEPTPDDGTDRGFFFRLATGHGWSFRGVQSGYVFVWSAHRITLHFGAGGALTRAERNFGSYGDHRSFHTNVPANITPWFHAFMDEGHDCGCTPLARSLEPSSADVLAGMDSRERLATLARELGWIVSGGSMEVTYSRRAAVVRAWFHPNGTLRYATRGFGDTHHRDTREFGHQADVVSTTEGWLRTAQEAAEPPVQDVLPGTPDYRLRTLLWELEAGYRVLSQELEAGGDWAWGQDALGRLGVRLEELDREAHRASREAEYLLIERDPNGGKEVADALRRIRESRDRG